MVAVLTAFIALAAVGRPRHPSLAVLYCGIYATSILLIPFADTARYALPILPFLITGTAGGLRTLARGRRAGTLALVALVAAAVATDVRQGIRPHSDSEPAAEFHALSDWITANLPSDAILVGAWDASYYLFTGRQAIRLSVMDNLRTYYADATPTEFPEAGELAEAFQRIGACFFVHDTIMGGIEAVFSGRLMDAVEATAPGAFEVVYQSETGRFAIHRRRYCRRPAEGAS
jgi:hypothetical protein